ncbi:Gfo/Idh/MocA family protein [Crocosphaera sp.]|uniref:Gfo/Idh/MocA family protein n=1 Tax=Crocosphaera sp. TaxID=2729996 RepID=UPI003F261199|nr:Gfo/Idh/MocA family oxidoreductase [Crocosphaera sp.]
MSKTINWGILGTGLIAQDFAQGLNILPDAKLLGIASRSSEKADNFAQKYQVSRSYDSYQALAQDPDIDVVYVATPNYRHKADCLMCLEANKAILCEKPFMLNAKETREVITLAQQKKLFCMEAMWMRFMPLIQKVKSIIEAGTIGEICLLTADFGYRANPDPQQRFYNLDLGGGALLDRTIYPLSLAFYLLGEPQDVVSQGVFSETKIDEQNALILRYPKGQLAVLSATLKAQTSNEVVITGSLGKIRIHSPFYRPLKLSITQLPQPSTSGDSSSSLKQKIKSALKQNSLLRKLALYADLYDLPLKRKNTFQIKQIFSGNGYNYEAQEVINCLQTNQLESTIMPLNETLKIMEIMDSIRHQWHLIYPQEQ